MQQGFESDLQLEDTNMMTKVEAIVQPSRFEAVKEVLTELGIGGMTISDVRGHGGQRDIPKSTGAGNTPWISSRRSRSRWLSLTTWWMPQSTQYSKARLQERSAMARSSFPK